MSYLNPRPIILLPCKWISLMERDGYMSSDDDHNICIDRRLFQPENTDPNDHDNHYHYLWNDLVGAVVWFLTAGISIACGVGGGGIYVPLGILLF